MENPRRETDNTKLQSKQDRNFKSCKSVSTRAYQKSSNTRSADLAAVWFAALYTAGRILSESTLWSSLSPFSGLSDYALINDSTVLMQQ